jgi:gliding motility-associated lipoprotein GldB
MKRIIALNIFILSVIIFFSCSSNNCEEIPDTSNINLEVGIERLDQELGAVKTKEQLSQFFVKHPEVKKVFSAEEYPNDSIFIAEFFKIISNPHVDTIFQDVSKVFANTDDLEEDFTEAFKNLTHYYPNIKLPKIRTVASGFFSPDFYISDSVIYIGLDYFTGPDGHYPPPGEPDYIVRRYRKEYIVPTVIRIISTSLNATDVVDKTMMAEIIYWGKSYYFVNKILPCAPDSLIIGYSDKQLRSAVANQERIWSHFVEKQLLFETSHFQKTKYIGDRPYTAEISAKCPGRIGQWLGWKIVNKYMKEQGENVTLNQLMANKNAQDLFNKSKFKPKDGEGL